MERKGKKGKLNNLQADRGIADHSSLSLRKDKELSNQTSAKKTGIARLNNRKSSHDMIRIQRNQKLHSLWLLLLN